MKKIISIAVLIYLAATLNACTNSKSDEGNPEQAPVESSLDNPDGGGAPATADGKKAASPDEAQAGFLDDQLPDDSMDKKDGAAKDAGAKTADAGTPAADAGLSLDEPPPAGGAPAANTPPPADAASMASMDTPPPADDKPAKKGKSKKKKDTASADAPAGDLPMKTDDAGADKPKPASLAKIKDAPYHEGSQLLNTVYIARPGDDYKKVSSMIYGSDDHVKDLKAANPGVKKLKPGQKVYYNSPKRMTDETKMMTFYEDSGIPPKTYVAKDGDDLKKVSKDLLGYPEGWKEVWATNAIESKTKIPAGTELKYWDGAGAVAGTPPPTPGDQANAAAPPPPGGPTPPAGNMPPPPPGGPATPGAQAGTTPPPPPDANMPPPPPPMPDQAAAGVPPPPPPPSGEVAPPPPGGAPGAAGKMANDPKKPKVGAPAEEGGLDQESMMYLAVGGVVAAGLAGIMIIRKRRQNKGAGYEAQVS